jgi:GAF domain-containing protein
MHDNSLLLEALSGFARTLLTPYDVDAVLTDLSAKLTEVLGLAGSGVTLASEGKLRFATAFPPDFEELERVQQDTQAGPCVSAYRTGQPVVVADLRSQEEVWPRYTPVAARVGVLAVAGIPLRLQDHAVGALNLYHAQPRDWTASDLATAGVMADMATGYLINASKLDQQEQLNRHLQHALDSRIVIEQAKGVVANAHHVSMDEAFARIRNHARAHNATVHTVAAAIASLGLRI